MGVYHRSVCRLPIRISRTYYAHIAKQCISALLILSSIRFREVASCQTHKHLYQWGGYGKLPCVGLNRKERIAALERKKQQIANRIVRLRNQESSKQRKIETRRKILAGAWALHQAERHPAERQRLIQGLDGFLDRPQDRELFDLDPKKENGKAPPETPPPKPPSPSSAAAAPWLASSPPGQRGLGLHLPRRYLRASP